MTIKRTARHVVTILIVVSHAGCAAGPVRILSEFGDTRGPEGYPRQDGPHRGVDIAAVVGTAVIAPADGKVIIARDQRDGCGNLVMLSHPGGYRTVYCHLTSFTVSFGDEVKRGEIIGYTGTTGLRPGPGYEHLHWELRSGSVSEDPLPLTTGCFDATQSYPADHLVLTWPIECGRSRLD
jgi:murein DD-endopeptidase MepM/ murein hydrolase activator NlpD